LIRSVPLGSRIRNSNARNTGWFISTRAVAGFRLPSRAGTGWNVTPPSSERSSTQPERSSTVAIPIDATLPSLGADGFPKDEFFYHSTLPFTLTTATGSLDGILWMRHIPAAELTRGRGASPTDAPGAVWQRTPPELPWQQSEDRFIIMSARSSARRPVTRLRAREAAASAILEAAEEVASERGLDATSTAAIAERAGVAVGTLYNYFPDRDALIAALFRLRRDALLPRMVAVAGATAHLPFEDRLRAYLGGVAGAFDEFRRFCKVALSADGTIRPKPRSVVLAVIVDALTEILRPVSQDRADEHARMLIGALKALMQWRLERDEPLEPAGHLIVDTFLPGIRPGLEPRGARP
jgi:AcrR family transcriptional regulator